MSTRTRVVGFWRDVELFSPQSIAKLKDSTVETPVRDVGPPCTLPWHRPQHQQAKNKLMWVHHVYVGVYPMRDMFERLDAVFTPTAEVFDERPSGESAVALLVVNQGGTPLPDETVLSTCAWGLGHSREVGSLGFAAFGKTHDALKELVRQYVVGAAAEASRKTGQGGVDETGLSVEWDHLQALERMIRSASGLGDDPLAGGIRIRSVQVSERSDDLGGDFLNSFLFDDLTSAADQMAEGVANAALNQYLAGPRRSDERIDVRKLSWAQTLDAVGAHALAPGRWPSEPNKGLALSQQLALSLTMGTMPGTHHDRLLAVNGPPGTGKTTLLRDVLANLVVRRADAMAELPSSADAFRKEDDAAVRWRQQNADGGQHSFSLWPLHRDLIGFEMVLASSNNRAVENVSDELPLRSAVADAEASYLVEVARSVRRAARSDGRRLEEPEELPPVWGLISARLGSSKNRGQFSTGFWWSDHHGEGGDADEPYATLRSVLDRWRKEKADKQGWRDPWPEAHASYRAARARVDALIAEARAAEGRLREQATMANDLVALRARDEESEEYVRQASRRADDAHRRLSGARHTWDEARRAREEHLRHRPNVLEWLATLGKASRRWSEADRDLADRVAAERHAVEQAMAVVDEVGNLLHAWREEARRLRVQLQDLHERQVALADAVTVDRARWREHYPDAQWWTDQRRRAVAAPWQNAEMNEARSELLLAALHLHEALLRSQPGIMMGNLWGVAAVLKRPPRGLSPEQLLEVWQVLFLVIPLVSTTFSSVGRMFGTLPSGGLGWLLVDEAGQATPQAAVGAMWRSARVLVVGDPLQLTPIVTLPRQAEMSIAEHHGAPEWALPSGTSVQALADGTSRFGTQIGSSSDDGVWVGAPLIVHRRCDDPMFTVSNMIAYDGMMIQGKQQSPTEVELRPSQWVHVPSAAGGGHGIEEQAARAARMVSELLRQGLAARDIIAIAPFRAMADAVMRAVKAVDPGVVAGTVHTAQGREATVVLFVLGGDKARPGAMAWASGTPNLVNVGVSRAKQRLYVIGDRDDWATRPYFNVLDAELAAQGTAGSASSTGPGTAGRRSSSANSSPDSSATRRP